MVGGIQHSRKEVILVLCQANVARSPLAGAMLRAALDRAGRHDIDVQVAGLHATPGTSVSHEACQVARERGLDLSQHTAVAVLPSALADAALVLTMDEAQRAAVSRLLPGTISRTFTLPELSRLLASDPHQVATIAELAARAHRARPLTAPAEAPEDIADPVTRPLRHYQRTADRLARLVDDATAHVSPAVPATSA
jgi:protein-tyrosine phosphatase